MGKAAFTKAAIVRAMEAVKEAGFEVGTVEITADGTIRVLKAVAVDTVRPKDAAEPKRWAG